jgi:hypothetical protein
MKNWMVLILLVATFSCGILAQEPEAEAKTEIRALEAFDKIRVSKGVNVTLVEGEKPQAEIYITNAETSEVIIEQKGSELFFKMYSRNYTDVALNIYVTYQKLREISVGSGGTVESEDLIEADELVLEAGMDGNINLEVEVQKLTAKASTAIVEVIGTADVIDVRTSTRGKFLGASLKAREATVSSNTGSTAQIWVTDKIVANVGSGAKVEYAGNPEKVEAKETMGGKAVKFEQSN